MIYAERGNKVVSITEDAISRYVEQGFTIKDETGTVLKKTVPVDIPNLKKSYVEQMQKIDSLNAENEYLKSEIERLKAELETAKTAKPAKAEKTEKAEKVETETAVTEEVVEKPKKTRASKSE